MAETVEIGFPETDDELLIGDWWFAAIPHEKGALWCASYCVNFYQHEHAQEGGHSLSLGLRGGNLGEQEISLKPDAIDLVAQPDRILYRFKGRAELPLRGVVIHKHGGPRSPYELHLWRQG